MAELSSAIFFMLYKAVFMREQSSDILFHGY